MRRRSNHNLGELPYDVPIPTAAVMFNSDGTVTLETAGEAPVTNRGRRRNQYHDPHAKRETMLHELAGHLADLVEAGEMSADEANDWYNMKADQWAQGLNSGRRSNEKPDLVGLINVYNESTDPGAYRSDEEHARERERAREALRAIRRHYVEGVDYKEFSNGMLWPISRNRGRRRNPVSAHRQVLDYRYDPSSNKTHVQVETPEFTQWYSIKGRVSRSDALQWLEPTIQRDLAEF